MTVLVVLLSACATPSEPETLAPVESPAPSATQGAAPSDLPELQSPTPPTAEHLALQALEEYFSSANSAAQGGDLDVHRRTYAASCAACVAATNDFKAARQEGLRANGDRFGEWTLEVEGTSRGQVQILSVIEFAAVDLVDEAGKVVDEVPAWRNATFVWTVAEQPDRSWLVIQGQSLP